MNQESRARASLGADPAGAAGPVGYLLLTALLAKLARGVELAVRMENARPLLLLPASVGQDLVLVAGIGLLVHALGRLQRPRLRAFAVVGLLIPIALLLPCDVLAYKLTGRPLTVHRLLGGEGATLADSNLLDPRDLIGVCAGMALALALLWPALRYARRLQWLRRLSRPRPLLFTLLAGCALALLQSELLPRAQDLADQPVFVLAGSLFEGAGLRAEALDERAWQKLHEPQIALPPLPPLPPRPKTPPRNVVIFLGEGIPFRHTGFDARFAGGIDPTPNLTRRFARHGLLFDRYYATWHASIQALFSIACSMFPPMSGDIVRVRPRLDCGELSEVLHAHGITPGLFHSGQFSFYNKLALLGRRAYAIELDASELAKTSHRATHEWGIDDRAMVDATLQWVDTLPKQQPFVALLVAVSPHYPYWLPPDYKPPFADDSREHQFLNGVSFVDSVFEQLLQGFEARGLYDDTLFIWLGDHGHYVGEPERETPGLRQFYEPNLRTPLLLLNSQMFPESLPRDQRITSRVGSHVDLLPTVLDALGVDDQRDGEASPHHQGQSLLSASFQARRVFFGATEGRYVGFFEGPYKFIARTRRKGNEYYDLANDPDELHNLSAQYPDRMQSYAAQALRFASASEARIAATPLLHEDVSVGEIYEMFMHNVSVSVRTAETGECSGGSELSCPELGQVLRVETKRVQGDQRRCVMAKLPEQGSLELTVRDPATLELMTGTTIALPARKGGRRSVRIGVSVDAAPQTQEELTQRAAVRPRHPRPEHELRFAFRQLGSRARDPNATGAAAPASSSPPAEICVQLTNLFTR